MMKLIKQIKMEIKNTLRSKFLLIIGLIILSSSIILPVIGALTRGERNSGYYPTPISARAVSAVGMAGMAYESKFYGGGGYGEEPIVVDGVTIEMDNPFYWQINQLVSDREYMDVSWFTHQESLDILLELMDIELDYYVRFAQYVKVYEDYRNEIAWTGQSALYEKFTHEHIQSVDVDALKEAIGYRYGYNNETFDDMYVNITAEERLLAIDEAEAKLERLFRVVENNDFPEYIALRVEQEQDNIAGNEEMIAILEKQITENPNREEDLNQQIEQYRKQIAITRDTTIPLLEYRLQKNIIPGDGSWQNNALNDIQNAESSLQYTTILSEEDFNKDQWLVQQHRTYLRYRDSVQAQIDEYNKMRLIAKNSVDADMPDMKFVPEAARSQTVGFLGFSTFVALFGILVGGWMIASEFQLGTVRLLMIRPLTRTKILMSKFAAGLIICLAIYLAGSVLNGVMNGICFGFSDYGFPNFTASGQVGFLGFYLPKLLACTIPILFGFCVAFMLSTTVKNIAVSIAVPIVCFIGCVILNAVMLSLMWRDGGSWDWIAWTPVPYVLLSDFFMQYSTIDMLRQNGLQLSLGYGIGLLSALSAICAAISIWAFKKSDITH